jgi:predicted nucleic acid-binding protein
MTVYVVDTNFFIQAHRSYYPLDVVPTFWRRVRDLAEEGKIVSIDKVKDEIYGNKDALRDWCKSNLPHNFFCNSEDVIAEY